MAHSSSGGTPSMKTEGTMVGVPTPGGANVWKPAAEGSTQVHGTFPDGGLETVKPSGSTGSQADWAETGGAQQVKPA